MLINYQTCVSTQKVALVPYAAHHVPKYHEWMKDPDIQEATASEPLTLEEEYAMQRSWRKHGNKLTFVICRPFELEIPAHGKENSDRNDVAAHSISIDNSEVYGKDEIDAMIGDVNLFVSDSADDESDPDDANGPSPEEDTAKYVVVIGELELMIAEPAHQGRGYGRAALLLFLDYIVRNERAILEEFHRYTTHDAAPQGQFKSAAEPSLTQFPLQFDHFSAKIGSANQRSLRLFEGLGFRKESETPSYFGEFELRLDRERLMALVGSGGKEGAYQVQTYRCACDSDGGSRDAGQAMKDGQ
ncbi:hypothetical protein H2200_009399 [Cladophialophora chaetospira]|uniref:N-acetyltransferase domain-containing protein n=1 Tax=Cladophialophora chaetospira TaxID=386627 RepID=A0AA38X438_9EURO|nr:hypothetical protein H2200_009399 [Cladophialophora chaetospira]